MSSRTDDYSNALTFHCFPVVTSDLPSCRSKVKELSIPSIIRQQLADPQFHEPRSTDCMLGADVFFEIFYGEEIAISNTLVAHSTALGWIVTGQLHDVAHGEASTSLITHGTVSQSAVVLHAI